MKSVDRLMGRLRRARSLAGEAYDLHVGSRLHTFRDEETGFFYQLVGGRRVFLRSRRDYVSPTLLKFLCEGIYFRFHEPSGSDVVVDVGAGYGHEALYVLGRSPGVRYFGIEVQPSIYESLCNSFRPVLPLCRAIGWAVSADADCLQISSSENYTKASTVSEGYIEVPAMPWSRLLGRYGIGKIDLLKVNIEGAERFLLPAIGDMGNIGRIVISSHDFRAERGDGDHFATRSFVMDYLRTQGYALRCVDENDSWLRNWIYGERLR